MRYQERTFSCGAASVLNAARCFGRRIPERIVRSVAETTPEVGTNDDGIVRALAVAGLHGTVFASSDFRVAIAALADTPAIICVQNLQHWVTVIGRTDGGRRWIIVDSARTKANIRENGVAVLDKKALKKAWQTRNGEFGGILVTRP